MALKLGDLVAFITVDDSEFERRLDQAKTDFEGFGDKLKGAALVAGAAVAAALGAGMVETLDIEASNDKLAAQLGSSKQDAKRLGEVAGKLYAGAWGDSMDQVNQAIRGVVQNIDGMDEASYEHIENVSASVLDLATAFDQDLNAATRAAGKLITTGLAKDATEALDLLTRGFQSGANQADDLLEVVSEYSTMFRDVGLDGQQAMGLISQGLQAGARDADTVADAIKEFAIRAQDGSQASAEGFALLGLNAAKMTKAVAEGGPAAEKALGKTLDRLRAIEDPAKRNAAAVALFGTKAEDLGDALFSLDLDTATDELGKVEGAAAEMGDTLNDNAKVDLESFKRQAQQALTDKLAAAIPHIRDTAKWLGEHKAIVVPLVTVLGSFAAVIGIITAATKVWTITQAALNVVMMLNPLGLFILAIVAVVAAIVVLYNKSDTARKIIQGAFKGIVAVAKWWWENLAQRYIKGVAAVAMWLWEHVIRPAWKGIKGAFEGAVVVAKLWWRGVKRYIELAAGVVRWVRDRVRAYFRAVGGIFGWVGDRAVALYRRVRNQFNKVVGFVRNLPGRIRSAASGMWDGIKGAFRSAINWIIGKWNNLSFTLPSVTILGQTFGGGTLSTPNIPYLARGGDIMRSGWATVGERGAERLWLPRGARVEPLDRPQVGGCAEVHGTIILRGDGILRGLRRKVGIRGGSFEATFG